MSEHNAPLNSVALKASAGAAEVLPLVYIRQPASFVERSKTNGWKFYAAAPPMPKISEPANTRQSQLDTKALNYPLLSHPCVLMLGNEGTGLSPVLQRKANFLLSFSGDQSRLGGIDSLNVGVAAGVLCDAFELSASNRIKKDLF